MPRPVKKLLEYDHHEEIIRMSENGIGSRKIAEKIGTSKQYVLSVRGKSGFNKAIKPGRKKGEFSEKEISDMSKRAKLFWKDGKFKAQEGLYGYKNPAWKGGMFKCSRGYWHVNFNGEFIKRSRFIVQEYIKRKLTSRETIHHIDENKENDNIKNLYLFNTNEEHLSYHGRVRSGKVARIEKSNLI